MGRFRFEGWTAATVLAFAAFAGSACGQSQPPQFQYTPPAGGQSSSPTPFSDPDYFQREKDYAQNWENHQDQSSPSPGSHDPTSSWLSADHLMLGMEIALAVIVACILFWAGARVYLHCARPSDPMKHAMSDPWLRAHLAGQGASPPPPPPGPLSPR